MLPRTQDNQIRKVLLVGNKVQAGLHRVFSYRINGAEQRGGDNCYDEQL
jgi:hypothetical protein